MAQVLRLPRPRRHRPKWSAVRVSGNYVITLEWRTADRAMCAVRTIGLQDWGSMDFPDIAFWLAISYLRELAVSQGARF